MKLADLTQLKPGPDSRGAGAVAAETELFDLTVEEVASWPEIIEVFGDGDSAFLPRELPLLIRRAAPEVMGDILEHCPVGVVAIDQDSRIIFANQAYTGILGIPLNLNGPPANCFFGGRPQPQEIIALWPTLIPRDAVQLHTSVLEVR